MTVFAFQNCAISAQKGLVKKWWNIWFCDLLAYKSYLLTDFPLGVAGNLVDLAVSRAVWPNTNKWRLLIGSKPIRADTSVLVICWDQCVWRIWHWHFIWNASNVFLLSQKSSVQVSAAYSSTDNTTAWYRRILVLSWRLLSCRIRLNEDMSYAARLILCFMSGRLLSLDFCKLVR